MAKSNNAYAEKNQDIAEATGQPINTAAPQDGSQYNQQASTADLQADLQAKQQAAGVGSSQVTQLQNKNTRPEGTTKVGDGTTAGTTGATTGATTGTTATGGTTTGTTTPGTTYTEKITITSPEVDPLEHLDTSTMEDQINKWFETSKQQQENRIDYATNQGITELERAKEDAQEQFQTQRNQVDIDEAKALDNQALYAEARGDKGGIGQAQYNQIQNAAATNRMTVNKAQTKLATDTARQIADLRAQGEFQKADAVLTLTQNYLSQLFQLGQWAAEYNLSIDQFNASLNQWAMEYEMGMAELGLAQDQWQWQVGQAEQENLANAGWAILEAGIMPSESQLAAMGLTPQQATDFLNTRKLSGRRGGIDYDTTQVDGEDNFLEFVLGRVGLQETPDTQRSIYERYYNDLLPAERAIVEAELAASAQRFDENAAKANATVTNKTYDRSKYQTK